MKVLCQKYFGLLTEERKNFLLDIGLLFLRISAAGMLLCSHGWGKLMSFGEKYTMFPDPLGLGSPVSMALAVGAEFFCAIAVILGFATRFTAVPVIVTMLVAAFVVHADDPWQKKEFALLYLLPFLTLVLTGAGKFSVDAVLSKKCKE